MLAATSTAALARQHAATPATPASPAPPRFPIPAGGTAPVQPEPNAEQSGLAPLGHVETRGSGERTLVLIPGLACDWSVWDEFMTRNASNYTMHAVTLPGFGGSAAPGVTPGSTFADLAWLDNAEWAIIQHLDEHKIEKPVLVGVGLGGQLALRLAIHHPERFGAVVDVQGYPAFPFRTRDPITTKPQRAAFIAKEGEPRFRAMPDATFDEMVQAYPSTLVADAAKAQALTPILRKTGRAVWTRYYFEFLAEDLTAELASIRIPVLVVAALEYAPGPMLEESKNVWRGLFAGLPAARIEYLENTRELVMLDRPAELDRMLAEFLK